jgi:hypothetical protein
VSSILNCRKGACLIAKLDSLGKTIQTLTRIAEGKRTEEERDAGWSATTLYVSLTCLISRVLN